MPATAEETRLEAENSRLRQAISDYQTLMAKAAEKIEGYEQRLSAAKALASST